MYGRATGVQGVATDSVREGYVLHSHQPKIVQEGYRNVRVGYCWWGSEEWKIFAELNGNNVCR